MMENKNIGIMLIVLPSRCAKNQYNITKKHLVLTDLKYKYIFKFYLTSIRNNNNNNNNNNIKNRRNVIKILLMTTISKNMLQHLMMIPDD